MSEPTHDPQQDYIASLEARVSELEQQLEAALLDRAIANNLASSMETVAKNNYAMWQSHKETVEIQARELAALTQAHQQAVEAAKADERHFLGIIAQLLTFAPREDSSKMPLPSWVISIKEKAKAALAIQEVEAPGIDWGKDMPNGY